MVSFKLEIITNSVRSDGLHTNIKKVKSKIECLNKSKGSIPD